MDILILNMSSYSDVGRSIFKVYDFAARAETSNLALGEVFALSRAEGCSVLVKKSIFSYIKVKNHNS